MSRIDTCPHCGGTEIYFHKDVRANRPEMQLLPDIHIGFLGGTSGKFDVYVCVTCGYTRFFVQQEFLEVIRKKWARVETRLSRHE